MTDQSTIMQLRLPAGARRTFAPMLLMLLVALAAACGGAPSRTGSDVHDFPLVVYQGHEHLGGHETTFAKLFERGQPVVLNFWAGQCPPCRAEMPAFQRAADEYDERVLFVGVDVGPFTGLGSSDDGRRLLADLQISYPAAAAAGAEPLRLYQVRSMPTTLFFDQHGRIVEQVSGLILENRLRRSLERLVTGAA